MLYNEFQLNFEEKKSPFESLEELKILDVTFRLGNRPIVRNLYRLFELDKKTLPTELQLLYEKKELFTIVHAIGTVSQGAKIQELIYDAEILDLDEAQTIDLVPNTKFNEWLKLETGYELALSANGNVSAKIPEELTKTLELTETVELGGGIEIKTTNTGSLSGKFTFSFKFPVTQSMGVGSNKCMWILNPDKEKPLNGDQLLLQTIAVPKGTKKIKFKISGEITADKGIFWKKQTQKTEPMIIEVKL